MKKLSLILLMFACGFIARAQSKDEVKVAAAVEKLRLAMISGNKADLESVLSDALTYGHSSGKIQDKQTFVAEISSKKSDFVSIELSGQSISIAGDVATVQHILDASTNDGGVPAKPHLGVVLVWKKIKAEWKLVARRSFRVAA